MNKSSVLVFTGLAVSVMAGCSSKPEETFCPPAKMPVIEGIKVSDTFFGKVTPISINEFNLKSYEGPMVDGEVHLKKTGNSNRYVLMQMPRGQESLYVVRQAAMNYDRYNEQDIAFLAEQKTNATVVTSHDLITVIAPSNRPNEINYIQTRVNDKGYQGRTKWRTLKGLDGVATQFVEFELETAISINNMPYALAFAKVENESGTEIGVVTFDLTNNNSYQYQKLMDYSGERILHGNVMYINQWDDKVMVGIFDKVFKYTHKPMKKTAYK